MRKLSFNILFKLSNSLENDGKIERKYRGFFAMLVNFDSAQVDKVSNTETRPKQIASFFFFIFYFLSESEWIIFIMRSAILPQKPQNRTQPEVWQIAIPFLKAFVDTNFINIRQISCVFNFHWNSSREKINVTKKIKNRVTDFEKNIFFC